MRFSRNWIAEYTDLPDDRQVLSDVLSMLGLVVDDMRDLGDDLLLDLDLPSNRPDVMNHFEIARELSVARALPLRTPRETESDALDNQGLPTDEVAGVTIEDRRGCMRFMARAVFDVKIGSSPAWLCQRLESIGLRPINNVVDVTNFVMWELGRPMHAYDLDELQGQCLVVRPASPSERLTTLDEIERELTSDDLVIADAERPIGLAGVMGGMSTAVTETTTTVLLECACFDAVTVRRMAKRHGLHTDASHRFERGMSVQGIRAATERAAQLIAETGGGTVSASGLDVQGQVPPAVTLHLSAARLRSYLGASIEPAKVTGILEGLGFGAKPAEEGTTVQVPPRRGDVRLEVDLIEEVARFHGYDRLPSTLPVLRGADGRGLSPALADEARLRRTCAALGYWEALTFVFTSEAEQRPFLLPDEDPVVLSNPLSEAMGVLRRHLVPGLLASLVRNLNNGASRVRLFEIGRSFAAETGGAPPLERRSLALVACGPALPRHFCDGSRELDLLDLKGNLDTLAARMRWQQWDWQPAAVPGLQEGLAAHLAVGESILGFAGKLDPDAARAFGSDLAIWVAQIDIHDLVGAPHPPLRVTPLPRYPASARDVSLLVASDVAYARVEREVLSLQDLPLTGIELIDVFRGRELASGHMSLTLRLTYRSTERTLTAEEIEAAHESVVAHLERSLGARRR